MLATFIAVLASLLSTPASAQDVALSNGEIMGTVRVDATCASTSKSCIWIKNDDRTYPMEVISVSYLSAHGQVLIESPPVIDGRLQCIRPGDRPCAPVLTPGEQGAMELPEPPSPGQFISVKLRLWDTPGAEVALDETPTVLNGIEVLLIGDFAASGQRPSTPSERRVVTIGKSSWFANWAKGTKY